MKQKCSSDNYILSDADTPEDFIKGVERETKQRWNVIEKLGPMSKTKIRRVISFYITPLIFLITHPKAKNVIAWQQFFGILSTFYNRYIFRRRNLSVVIMTFIYKPKLGFTGKLFYKMVNSAVCSKYVKAIVVFSQNEIEYYEKLFPKAKGKFNFVKLGIEVDNSDYTDIRLAKQDYFFATGISNRDYEFLIDVFSGIDTQLKIACPNVKNPPHNNIEILNNCFKAEMKRYLFNCKAVVIPLKDPNISSGQLVFIQAMQFGKPIIITDSKPAKSYLKHNTDALVLPNELSSWRQGIKKLNYDNELYYNMSTHNRERGLTDFSIAALGENVGRLV